MNWEPHPRASVGEFLNCSDTVCKRGNEITWSSTGPQTNLNHQLHMNICISNALWNKISLTSKTRGPFLVRYNRCMSKAKVTRHTLCVIFYKNRLDFVKYCHLTVYFNAKKLILTVCVPLNFGPFYTQNLSWRRHLECVLLSHELFPLHSRQPSWTNIQSLYSAFGKYSDPLTFSTFCYASSLFYNSFFF